LIVVWPESTIFVPGQGDLPVPVGCALIFSGSQALVRHTAQVTAGCTEKEEVFGVWLTTLNFRNLNILNMQELLPIF
jgi:hypothetical protein